MQGKNSPILNFPLKILECDGFNDRFTALVGISHLSAETYFQMKCYTFLLN